MSNNTRNTEKGFFSMIIVLAVAMGAMYLVKDENGVNYLEGTYNKVKYYVVDRNTDAIEKAKDAKNIMQNHQNDLANMLKEY